MEQKNRKNIYEPVMLNIKAKGDQFIYYKRRFEKFEHSMQVYHFWSNSFMLLFSSISVITNFFLLILIDHNLHLFQGLINIHIYNNTFLSIDRANIYVLFFIPLLISVVSFLLGYYFFQRNRSLTYILFFASITTALLFVVATLKIFQLAYGVN